MARAGPGASAFPAPMAAMGEVDAVKKEREAMMADDKRRNDMELDKDEEPQADDEVFLDPVKIGKLKFEVLAKSDERYRTISFGPVQFKDRCCFLEDLAKSDECYRTISFGPLQFKDPRCFLEDLDLVKVKAMLAAQES